MAPTLLASISRIKIFGPIHSTLNCLNLSWLPFFPKLQLNLPLPGFVNHVLQGPTFWRAKKLPDVIFQHVMTSCLLHLLIQHILCNQQSPLPKFDGDLRHSLCCMEKVSKLSRQPLHLDSKCKLYSKSSNKIMPGHGLHSIRSHRMTNLLPTVMSSIPH